MHVLALLPFLTFGPSWVAHLSSWGHPQSIFFHHLEDSYARFNVGDKVETGGILCVGWIAEGVEHGRRPGGVRPSDPRQ
jgi:hypothetical protein